MSAQLLDGKFFASQIKEETRKKVEILKQQYDITPGLTVVIVGENPASQIYVANKHKTSLEMGVHSQVIRLPEQVSKEELLTVIDGLNQDPAVHGILVQLPLPEHIKPYESEILEAIQPAKDVDGFHPVNVGKLATGQEELVPCTPHGCIRLLELAGLPIKGKRAVVLGRSNIVGKPMFHLLLARHATVTVCHSCTQDLAAITREADILVAAIGKPKFVTSDMVKPGAVVIDVGINRVGDKKIVGDVDFDAVKEIASAITPVPGGVGVLTIAMLLYNTVKAAQIQHKVQV
ncbi:bifunctional methylenetetrahydrofolate dehydrogenase/methenyltetrahydrofolate cyclohydrolase FolD [Propionispora hippei]|uniref:Bifunctional protein FolD n=1 Tax=Propionispora hippei DSM 15287 TaxID=1123003 RepID=A0A1M6A4P6_9FIRM|nr:bifunctional methylenetetrahydrofolate dehydrogenase/methenyltetrahydrofolate cyclohydrolase FolD [Propionispora hippei]SHI31410.1 methylenetetrahydrofolate dehydrogenase (NADP+) / methenyltetrahydrofolate cyclohydrolase [Propionispora hippei DSM 15287]